MSNPKREPDIRQSMDPRVLRTIEEEGSSTNCYGDNVLHVSAANNRRDMIKELLKTNKMDEINCKNNSGWTPLMQAIRNGNTEAVKLLLANGYSPNEDSFEDISPIGLAAAMGLTMFELVYNACPAALEYAKYNKISPLCAAVIKEDTQLLHRLLELGVDVSEAGEYTLLLMKQSRIPEMVKLAKVHNSATNDYWTEKWDTMQPIDCVDDNVDYPRMSSTFDDIANSTKNDRCDEKNVEIPKICVTPPANDETNFDGFNVGSNVPKTIDDDGKIVLTPRLNYTCEQIFPKSPNFPWTPENPENSKDEAFAGEKSENSNDHNFSPENDVTHHFFDDSIDFSDSRVVLNSTFNDDSQMHKYKINRPPNLNISKNDSGCSEYSSVNEKSDPELASCKTPMETVYGTPPAGMVLNLEQRKMAVILQRFGLTRFIITFLAQEVDLDLFLTLNEQDLREIGIPSKSDRHVLLSVIAECNRFQPV